MQKLLAVISSCNEAEQNLRRKLFGMIFLCFLASWTGCGRRVPPVSDVEQATTLIKQTFDDWKAGASLAAQRDKSPPVYVAEELWLNGTKLEEYTLNGPGELFGTNVRFNISLKCLGAASTKPTTRQLSYLVTTIPACTIAREDR